jgi:hypothetical protein
MTASGDFGDFSGSLSDIGGTDLSPGYDALGPTAGAVKLRTLPELQAAFAANTEGPYNINNEFVGSNLSTGATPPASGVAAPQEVLQAASEDGKGLFGDAGEKVKDLYRGSILDPSVEAAQAGQLKELNSAVARQNALRGVPMTDDQTLAFRTEWAKANPQPGLLSRSAPLIGAVAGVSGLAAYAAGMFDEEEEEYKANPNKSDKEIDAYAKWGQIADKNSPEAQKLFGIWNMKPYETRRAFETATGGPSLRPDWRFLPESNTMTAAMGGEVVGPGTGTSDSIPARLSDGEFVMTANAVQNAGGGNRDLGAARMYDMMRRFEGGVA